jgi:hypothetical protein
VVPRRARRHLAEGITRRLVYKPAPLVSGALEAEIWDQARPHVRELGQRLGRDLEAEWLAPTRKGAEIDRLA